MTIVNPELQLTTLLHFNSMLIADQEKIISHSPDEGVPLDLWHGFTAIASRFS